MRTGAVHRELDLVDRTLAVIGRGGRRRDRSDRHGEQNEKQQLLFQPRRTEPQLREALGEAIMARLPERERLVVTLHHYEELPMQQVAAILGVSPSTAYRLHRRALLRLKASLP
jgi:RNA polymerase sigma factor (sigma-70 family)